MKEELIGMFGFEVIVAKGPRRVFHVQLAPSVSPRTMFFFVPAGLSSEPMIQSFAESRFEQIDSETVNKRRVVKSAEEKQSGLVVTPMIMKEVHWATESYEVSSTFETPMGTFYGPFGRHDEVLLSPRVEFAESKGQCVLGFAAKGSLDMNAMFAVYLSWWTENK